jgi:methanogenic corrinoid protein MtbC1
MVSMRQQFTDEQGHMQAKGGSAVPPSAWEPEPDETDLRRRSIVEQTVEQDVIPRLLQVRRDSAEPKGLPLVPYAVTEAQLAELVRLVLAREEAKSISFVEGLFAAGYPAETLYLDLLAPTARQLGQMWVNDDCDFTDVTVGLFLLQNSLRELGATYHDRGALNPTAPRILLVPLPREQHTFGLSMVYDFFRRAGWNAWSGPIDSEAELANMVRGSWFDIVGFSMPCDEQLEDARAMIRIVRAASLNPGVAVMVGGPGFSANPDLAATIGADGTAVDGRQAVRAADALLALAAGRQCS